MSKRWDETWHRLREWTNGQGPSERLAAQVLLCEGYVALDPSHPLGGPDGAKDALCRKDGLTWVMAVFFPRGQQRFATTKKKFLLDLKGVAANGADALAFVTNQELTLAERDKLRTLAGNVPVDLFHLDRVTTVLDQPRMGAVRRQFLAVDFDHSVREALEALVAPGRDEDEIREAIIGVPTAHIDLLARGMEPGKHRCTKCGSVNVHTGHGEDKGRAYDVTKCADCGELLDVCI